MNLKIVNGIERADLIDRGDEIVLDVWPEFMMNDAVANRYFFQLYIAFPEFQYWILDGEEIVGIGNSIPLFWNDKLQNLPETGWDWALAKGFRDLMDGIEPNYLCALSITINPKYQGKGFSQEMVKAMKVIGEKNGLEALILPVRPNQKISETTISMQEYILQKRDDGLPQDAWLRVHSRLDAKILSVCDKSMEIKGSVQDWRDWTGTYFKKSGKYKIAGALDLVDIDLDKDEGIYIEPNVWMVHEFLKEK